MTTITELLKEAEQSINFSESAKLDAEILLCDVLQFNRSTIYSHPDQLVSEEDRSRFQSMVEKRRQGYPIAHLTGKKEFWSLEFAINKNTLIPRPETELLVETALQMIPHDAEMNILDLGTGSGAIAIVIAIERPNINIIATDINQDALSIAEKNAELHQVGNVQFLVSDWYKNIPSKSFDMILSNPPYIKSDDEHLRQGDVRFESELALIAGTDGMRAINIIIENAGEYLTDEACLMIEHGYDQKTLVQEAFQSQKFNQVKTLQDISGQDRVTLGIFSRS